MVKIVDEALHPYEIHEDHQGFHVVKEGKSLRKVGDLRDALGFISDKMKLEVLDNRTVTISEYFSAINAIETELQNAFKRKENNPTQDETTTTQEESEETADLQQT